MALAEKLNISGGTSPVVQGLGNYYVDTDAEKKSDLSGDHIVAEMSVKSRAEFTTKKWGVKRELILGSNSDGSVKGAIKEFDTRRISFNRKSRGEMETVLAAENRKEQQSQLDRWMGGLRR